MEEVIGENPTLGGDMLTMVELHAAIICLHGHTIAPTCALGCRRKNWMDCPVRPKNPGEKRTVLDVVKEFIDAGKIASVEVVERYILGEQKRERRRRLKKRSAIAAAIAGIAVTSLVLLFKRGELVLLLRGEKKPKETPADDRK